MSKMVDLMLEDLREKIEKVQESLKRQLAKIRTGRASVNLFDEIKADYYGQMTPIRNMANISIPEPRLMVIQPYDPSSLKEIEKSIQTSDLGLNPHNDGKVLRIAIPELAEERRMEITKIVRKITEEHRVSVRQVRREVNEELKKSQKDKEITEDDLHKGIERVQKEVDKIISELDKLEKIKEKEIMEI